MTFTWVTFDGRAGTAPPSVPHAHVARVAPAQRAHHAHRRAAGRLTEMIEAVNAAGGRLPRGEPGGLVALSARWVSAGPFHADDARAHKSVIDLPGFGVEPRYDCPGWPELARALV